VFWSQGYSFRIKLDIVRRSGGGRDASFDGRRKRLVGSMVQGDPSMESEGCRC
ncbi:hypothetical protein A2U01_0097834, partial [Trifolium medium]|nr:hypothetical protein [Trifolium medium]